MNKTLQALKYLNSGVMVVAVDKEHAFTAAWVMQVSFDPVLLAISINPEHTSYAIFKENKRCTVNVLDKSQMNFAAHYGRSGLTDKMSLGTWKQGSAAAPVLGEALVAFECCWVDEVAAGDHRLIICQVVKSCLLNEGTSMLYSDTENMDGSAELVAEIKA